ncbi:MAG: hypothetical protein P9D89_06040 [Candidatus Contendobacter sp.]|nr:hypothetical protein [Candidatus Contendobacter sp.]
MTADELASVTLEHLRAIRATQAKHGEELASIRVGKSEMDNLKRRVERIDRRSIRRQHPSRINRAVSGTGDLGDWRGKKNGWTLAEVDSH